MRAKVKTVEMTKVTLSMSLEDAKLLKAYLGNSSKNDVQEIVGKFAVVGIESSPTYRVVADAYHNLAVVLEAYCG